MNIFHRDWSAGEWRMLLIEQMQAEGSKLTAMLGVRTGSDLSLSHFLFNYFPIKGAGSD